MNQKPKQEPDTKRDGETEQLRAMIELLQKEKDGIFAKLQRVSADYTNFQKRVHKHISDSIAYEKELIIKTLLPMLDNLEHTLVSAHSSEDIETVVKGVQIIHDQMLDILKSHGIEQINALEKKFDPVLHQAMMRKHDTEKEEDIVLEEFQKGYKLNGRVIRPSRVVVNKPPEEIPSARIAEEQQLPSEPPEAGTQQDQENRQAEGKK